MVARVEIHHDWLWLGGVLVGYLVLMLSNPIRADFRDGFRCIQRHPLVWMIPAAFGFFYAAFQLGLRVSYYFVLPEPERPIFHLSRAWFLPRTDLKEIAAGSVLPAFESVAGIFNALVTTYPLSAVAAVLLLINWDGHHAVLNRALRRRFGFAGWLIYFAIIVCAAAAIAKPLLYAGFRGMEAHLPALLVLQISGAIDWLSFFFEYLFGVCIQIYLILLIYAWVRGISFTSAHLLDFAIRRFSFVVKWAALVIALSSLLIHLPLMLVNFPAIAEKLPPSLVFGYIDDVARPVLAAFLAGFASVQIILTFHSESLRKAVRDHLEFLRRNAGAMAWFFGITVIHFFLLSLLKEVFSRGFGEGTAAWIAWRLTFPLLAGIISGWMLASWVCFFKRCETGRSHLDNWIRF